MSDRRLDQDTRDFLEKNSGKLEIPKETRGAVEMAQDYVRQLLAKFAEEKESGSQDLFDGNIVAQLNPNDQQEIPLREASIYIVDDEIALAGAIKRMLIRAHRLSNIVTFRDGLEAHESMYHDGHLVQVPHLVITDTNMPRMGGEELARKLQEIEPVRKPRLIGLSAMMKDNNISTYVHFQHPVLQKPVELTDLCMVMSHELRQHPGFRPAEKK